MFKTILFVSLILQVTLAAAQTCIPNESGKGKCKTCDAIIGTDSYCSECAQEGEVPIDGVCIGKDDPGVATAGCQNSGGTPIATEKVCGQCSDEYFLHKGGCYSVEAEKPGHTICTTATKGVCTLGANGYFATPKISIEGVSVVACSDIVGATIDGIKYKGVADCTQCSPPPGSLGTREDKVAVCSRCKGEKYLKTDGTCANDSSGCTVFTEFAKADPENGNKCILCRDTTAGGIQYCEECSLAADQGKAALITCLACGSSKKLSPGKTSCMDACPAHSNDKATPNICECDDGYTPDEAGTQCTGTPSPPPPSDCPVENCQKCSADKKTCEECKDKNYLTPTKMCIDRCEYITGYYSGTEGGKGVCKKCDIENCFVCGPDGKCDFCNDGFYADGAGVCQKCDESCKTCDGGASTDCLDCGNGKIMSYINDIKGSCIPECTQGSGAGSCETCGLTINGAKYCSRCSQGNEYPQNGVCTTKARAAPTCKDDTIESGVCKVCADGFVKMNGGCYSTAQLPGLMVCDIATPTGDSCQVYSEEGYSLDGSGNVIDCPANCGGCRDKSTCTVCMDGYVLVASSNTCLPCSTGCAMCYPGADKCIACLSGYYLSGTACVKCTESSNNGNEVIGVADCLNCKVPSSAGPVICYAKKDSTSNDDDGTGGSTNRGGLSTGAIAGIAVAVVVVVGGLVGFLCWWFLCRGKA